MRRREQKPPCFLVFVFLLKIRPFDIGKRHKNYVGEILNRAERRACYVRPDMGTAARPDHGATSGQSTGLAESLRLRGPAGKGNGKTHAFGCTLH